MKNDIERMKAAFAEQLELAEKENELSEGLQNYSICVGKTNVQGCKYRIWMSMSYVSGVGFAEPTLAMGKEMLERFPMTKNTLYDKKLDLPYVIHSQNSYGDRYAELTIKWISGEYEVGACLKIDAQLREEFFNVSRRCAVDSEVSTYTSLHSEHLIGKPCILVYDFKKEHVKYHGGVRLLTDRDEIARIIDFIKSWQS